jgi:hypothetical protein
LRALQRRAQRRPRVLEAAALELYATRRQPGEGAPYRLADTLEFFHRYAGVSGGAAEVGLQEQARIGPPDCAPADEGGLGIVTEGDALEAVSQRQCELALTCEHQARGQHRDGTREGPCRLGIGA